MKKRPVNLDLATMHHPLPALTSIAHRITGVLLFIGLAFLFYLFDVSLSGEAGFVSAKEILASNFLAKFIAWGLLVSLAFHLLAGIKHLVMDFGLGEDLASAQLASKLLIVGVIILAVLAGVWVW